MKTIAYGLAAIARHIVHAFTYRGPICPGTYPRCADCRESGICVYVKASKP